MYKLLKINGITFPDALGSVSIDKVDKVNEYEAEDGSIKVEIVRAGVISGTFNFVGMKATTIKPLMAAIKTVNTVELYNPFTNELKTITAKITQISASKVEHRFIGIWGLNFQIDEL